MKYMTCPSCGFEMAYRNSVGEGTSKARLMKRMTTNHTSILKLLMRHGAMPVRGVLNLLRRRKVQRVSRTGTDFNDHTVQADLSILVGYRLVRMSKKGEDFFDPETGVFLMGENGKAIRAPKYYVPEEWKAKVRSVLRDRFQSHLS